MWWDGIVEGERRGRCARRRSRREVRFLEMWVRGDVRSCQVATVWGWTGMGSVLSLTIYNETSMAASTMTGL